MKNPFVTHTQLHKANDRNSVEEAAEDITESSIQRPQHHGERADTFDLDEMCGVPQAKDMEEKRDGGERMGQNIDDIAKTIMEMIDAVDTDENTKIKTICIEIGLE
jgi:hypothetical protein